MSPLSDLLTRGGLFQESGRMSRWAGHSSERTVGQRRHYWGWAYSCRGPDAGCCYCFCDSMHCSMPGFLLLHYLPEFCQTHIQWVGDAIQPSHPLLLPSPPAHNLSQHQSLFQKVGSSHQVAKVLGLQLQQQSFQWIFRVDFLLGLTGLISLQSKRLSRVFSSTTVQKHQFFSAQPFSSIHDYWKNHSCDCTDFGGKVMSLLFNMLSRFVIAFLTRNKGLLISWLQSLSADGGPKFKGLGEGEKPNQIWSN